MSVINLQSTQEFPMKTQFQSTEALQVRLPPFLDKTTGDFITGGADTCTLTIKKPDGVLLAGGPHLGVYDAAVDMWTFDVSVGSYLQGEWRVRAVSNDADAVPQWRSLRWGDYVESLATIATINTKVGTPVGASMSADIAAVAADMVLSRKMLTNRWKIETNQLKVYEDNGTTVFKTFSLFDNLGGPTSIRAFERVPV